MSNFEYLTDDIEKYLVNDREFKAVVCTTNQIIKNNGQLVMGAGIAKVFKDNYPVLPLIWGEQLKQRKKRGDKSLLMCVHPTEISSITIGPYLIAFPTKNHFKDKSSLSLINASMVELHLLADIMNFSSVLLPKPGCSNGGLSWETDVLPLIRHMLDERFTIIDRE